MTDLSPDELLAAEYVIGLLDRDQRRAAEDRLTLDPQWARVVARWQQQLSQMDTAFAPVPAPNLLPRIEARLFGVPPAAHGWWKISRPDLGWFLAWCWWSRRCCWPCGWEGDDRRLKPFGICSVSADATATGPSRL